MAHNFDQVEEERLAGRLRKWAAHEQGETYIPSDSDRQDSLRQASSSLDQLRAEVERLVNCTGTAEARMQAAQTKQLEAESERDRAIEQRENANAASLRIEHERDEAVKGCKRIEQEREAGRAGEDDLLYELHQEQCAHGSTLMRLDRATEALRKQIVEEYREQLREHFLAGIECDHDGGRDRASCSCSLVDLEWQPSVGEAVESWARHFEAVTLSPNPRDTLTDEELRQHEAGLESVVEARRKAEN